MTTSHTCPPGAMPCYELERDYLLNLQTDEFVEHFEAQSWLVAVDLGVFEDGQYFLRLRVLTGVVPLRLMSEEIWAGSCCAGMPVHITLGQPRWPLDEVWLASMVKGEYKLELKKWTDDRISSTNLLRGELESLCEWLGGYFDARDEWHLSL